MNNSITFSVDDFGLTRGITDTILETVDNGPVRLVSILANGNAVSYAITEYKKRAAHLSLAVHLNLTEGKALSSPADVPHLVDADEVFKYSVARLWLAYLFGSRAKREALRAEARREMAAQCEVILIATGNKEIMVNSHQHFHMIPFVFDELMSVKGVSAVRITREKFFYCGVPSLVNIFARFVLSILSGRAIKKARERGIKTNDWFVGFLYSGRMNEQVARAGIASIGEGSVEVLFHAGSALQGELDDWEKNGVDVAWHYSENRKSEKKALKKLNIFNAIR